MDFIDSLRQFAAKAEKQRANIQTEEATKTSLIMPFFSQVMGYDIFDSAEFVPEYTADVGIKKGEKVDYAIMVDGNPTILIEAKWCGESLEKHDSQLFRYFGTTKAKFAILTNGIIYRFYTDLESANKMDLTPFLEVNILDLTDVTAAELKRFTKSAFNAEELFGHAEELKYSNKIKAYFSEQLKKPSDEFVRFMAAQAYDGKIMQSVLERFRPIVQTSLNNLITETMNKRINDALNASQTQPEVATPLPPVEPVVEGSPKIVTTEEELQAFYIIKAVLAGDPQIDILKIGYKDTVNYFAVIFNNMPTKWICRLRLSESKKSIGLPNEKNEEVRTEFESLEDLYKFKDALLDSAKRFLNEKTPVKTGAGTV